MTKERALELAKREFNLDDYIDEQGFHGYSYEDIAKEILSTYTHDELYREEEEWPTEEGDKEQEAIDGTLEHLGEAWDNRE